jgi:hypothetical protein
MAKKRNSQGAPQAPSRREFFKQGAAAGVGIAVLSATEAQAAAPQPQVPSATSIPWHYEVDVVVIGGGCAGLPAAIRARDLGANVLVVDQNFDVGGKMLHSGAQISLGGGDPAQLRDIAGKADKEGFIKVKAQEDIAELTEDVDFLWRDMTDWSVVDAAAQAPYRYNDPNLLRGWADNCFATRQFLTDNYVRQARISGTHGTGGMSRARRAVAFLMLGDKTDIKAGTVTRQDAGIEDVSSSHFAPRLMGDGAATVGPGAVNNGAALARPLEFSAREKGVQFMLNMHMDEIIREHQFSGRVVGIKASYSPRIDPTNGRRLESLMQNGNVDERRQTVYIKARRGIVIASGGHTNNPQFRQMFYPAWKEPAFTSSAFALLGPRGQDASGIIAALRVGANLSGMQQNLSYGSTFHFPGTLATRDSYTTMLPGHPTFPFRGSTGMEVGDDEFEHLIVVNQVGKRFFNELILTEKAGGAAFPADPSKGQPTKGLDFKQLDWRNASADNVRKTYRETSGIYAALQINEGSAGPDYLSGPLWAIFDSAAVQRTGWKIVPPFVSMTNGYFFKADTIEELAGMIRAGHEYQRVPLKYLKETVDKWNAATVNGGDQEFARGPDAPMWKIEKPPFYAASINPVWHDSYGGLRVNGKTQVIDMEGQPIPGLYAGGEAVGGHNQHGLGKGLVHGYIAGSNVALERPA